MGTIIATEKSKQTIKRLIRNEFDKVDFAMDYIYGKADELIQTAHDFGLNDLAEEMTNDKNVA
jgi:hypothetical protein